MSHLYAGEENGTTEVETKADVEVVSAQGTEVVLQGGPTEESESAGAAVEESTGAGSHGGSDEQVEVESETETETESEDYAEGKKEDVEVHEQVEGQETEGCFSVMDIVHRWFLDVSTTE